MSETPKNPWETGWDAVSAHDDSEAAEDAVSGATSAFAAGFDLSDQKQKDEMALFFINTIAYELTLPQPTDADPDPLDTPEKESTFGKRMHALAERLASAYAQWDIHDRGECSTCQMDVESRRRDKGVN